MVVFTCNNCGDSVKKMKVEKHTALECRKKQCNVSLCCMDCLKDFNAVTFAEHTKCVTELERYSAKGFVAKASSNKGERKQTSWMDTVRSVLNQSSLTNQQKELLNIISEFENVPRKKVKFQSFLKNSIRHIKVYPDVINSVFDLLEKEFSASQTNATPEKKVGDLTGNASEDKKESQRETKKESATNGDDNSEKRAKKKKKEKTNVLDEIKETLLTTDTGSNVKLTTGKKKEKTPVVQNDNQEIVPPAEVTNEQIMGKKKKNKRKIESELENGELPTLQKSHAPIPLVSTEETNEQTPSKKKKKKTIESEIENYGVDENQLTSLPTSTTDQNTSKKKNKKQKIRPVPETNVQNEIQEKLLVTSAEVIDEQIRDKKKKKQKTDPASESDKGESLTNGIQIGCSKVEIKNNGKKKRKAQSSEGDTVDAKKSKFITGTQTETTESKSKSNSNFCWTRTVKSILETSANKEMSLKRLMKKIIREYQSCQSFDMSTDDITKKCIKKIKKTPSIMIEDDRIRLTA